jgi:hypothetical protein
MANHKFIIRNSDIMKLEGCTAGTASRKLNQVRFCLKRSMGKPVTMKEYCRYWEIDMEQATTFLNQKP